MCTHLRCVWRLLYTAVKNVHLHYNFYYTLLLCSLFIYLSCSFNPSTLPFLCFSRPGPGFFFSWYVLGFFIAKAGPDYFFQKISPHKNLLVAPLVTFGKCENFVKYWGLTFVLKFYIFFFIFLMSEELVQIFSDVGRIGTNEMWRIGTKSSHMWSVGTKS